MTGAPGRIRGVASRATGLVLLVCAAATLALTQPDSTAAHRAALGRGTDPPPGAHTPMPPGVHGEVVPESAMAPPAPTLSRKGWTATADGEGTQASHEQAQNVLDGDSATLWQSTWSGAGPPRPHTLTIDMHRTDVVSGMVYQPRQDGSPDGRIGEYAISLSGDGKGWEKPVATGTLADDATTKTLRFATARARYVRLTVSSEAGGRGPWASAAEINLLGDPGGPASGVDLPRDGWTATADSEETQAGGYRAQNALDGDPRTLWHTRFSGDAPSLPHSITIDMHRTAVVSGLTYEPRPDGPNGRTGQYSITTSVNGTTFGEPVATGSWNDDDTAKGATFSQPVTARYVRLTALTEAGGRGPWTSAAEVRLRGPADPSVNGSWSPVIGFPLVPVATAVLPNNKLLAWSAYAPDRFGGSNGYTQTALMDLTTGKITQRRVDNTKHDMFCPGIALLADGRVLVTGGSDASRASIYDPVADKWTSTGDMNIARGYQAMTLLPGGDAFVIGGSWQQGNAPDKGGEVWSAATGTWRRLPGVPVTPILTADPAGPYRADNHAWLYATSQGRILQFGPSKQLNWISTDGDGSITSAGTRADSPDAMNGDAVAYDVGKLLTLGGATAYENATATNRAYTCRRDRPRRQARQRPHRRHVLRPLLRQRCRAARREGRGLRRAVLCQALQRRALGPASRDLGSRDRPLHAHGVHGRPAQLPQRRQPAARRARLHRRRWPVRRLPDQPRRRGDLHPAVPPQPRRDRETPAPLRRCRSRPGRARAAADRDDRRARRHVRPDPGRSRDPRRRQRPAPHTADAPQDRRHHLRSRCPGRHRRGTPRHVHALRARPARRPQQGRDRHRHLRGQALRPLGHARAGTVVCPARRVVAGRNTTTAHSCVGLPCSRTVLRIFRTVALETASFTPVAPK